MPVVAIKKIVAKKSRAVKAPTKKSKPAVSVKVEQYKVPVVEVIGKEVQTPNGSVEVQHKYVFISTCRNCDHMPMGVNALVGILSITIAILSGMIIATSLPDNFEIPTISMGSFTNWITPDSRVESL
ncbi:MAG: hypothetical protein UY76_C0066G0004 [Candidatus Uhrbacteria bacterium GW2011_GWA2_52_8d]|uniref:Uncharacterized protein n=1 Tax=Candidatus Uhrbacteria bacterium GW2011_GWA2_52_8d TaxID=1618979 RepID=A0A0G1XJF9_9BACT|nr:MAG: hypothetical protein UY76_C0066G0004 [Candidatus Uhrbacteria bacterium GW2011_GWA2_52_8d]